MHVKITMKFRRFHSLFIIAVMIFLSGCDDGDGQQGASTGQEDTKAIAIEEGAKIAERSQQALAGKLQQAIQDSGIVYAIRFCNAEAYPLTDSLEMEFEAKIKRTADKVRNPNNRPSEAEASILAEFQQLHDKGSEIRPVAKAQEDGKVAYYQPILINNPLCLNCHGTVGETVQNENYEAIRKLYPEDAATGYQMGDLRGMWSMVFPKSAFSGKE